MSVARTMKSFTLQKKIMQRTPSGAKKEAWEDKCKINAAIYKSDEKILSGSERYKDATHVGLTYYREIEAGKYRLKQGDKLYYVEKSDAGHRLTNLLLKEVDSNV